MSSIPGVVMGLCVGEVGRPRWLALTEGTLSWSMPTGLRFMSFILESQHKSEPEPERQLIYTCSKQVREGEGVEAANI